MLGYIAIVCNGDLKKITKRNSVLTWYEEWFCFFEILWGRTNTRWCDLEHKKDGYGILAKYLRNILDQKLDLVMEAMQMMPAYAIHEEDKHFTSKTFKKR